MAVLRSSDEMGRSPHKTKRHIVSLVLVMVGFGLLGYVASQYWRMYRSQRQLELQWEQQAVNAYATAEAKAGTAKGGASGINPGGGGVQNAVARLSIPRIHLDAMVLEGASRHELAVGPGHLLDTPLPGENGNAVITAHRDTFFRHIFELQQGDEIQVWRDGQLFRYQVSGKRVVNPDDLSVLAPTGDAELTLITCYPPYYIGPAPQRLVVFSKLVP
jgi:LPXTG-site transpeptidase (sortase) family protein